MLPPQQHKASIERLPSFQIEKDSKRKLVIKMSRSCSYDGLVAPRLISDRVISGRGKSNKKNQLSSLLSAVGSISLRKSSAEPNFKTAPRLSTSKSRPLTENKSYVG